MICEHNIKAILALVDAAEDAVNQMLGQSYDALIEYCGPCETLRIINERGPEPELLHMLLDICAHLSKTKHLLTELKDGKNP